MTRFVDALELALREHGLAVRREGDAVEVQDGLVVDVAISPAETHPGSVILEVQVVATSPRLGGRAFVDGFAGHGATAEAAEQDAFLKFLVGAFHVLVEALTTHSCDASQVEWLALAGPGGSWRWCEGPAFTMRSGEGASLLLDGYMALVPRLRALFADQAAAGPHGVTVFLFAFRDEPVVCELRLDGERWPAAEALLAVQHWPRPEGYESLRHVAIALAA